ncbi:hypothetical protein [Methylobacter luteus]|uniref:hypothetical protein n=1 Tax=Methylobacter luteus TaxID=415 RepID=UPI0003F7A71E|nr:hypothetical protein [Methylobacter luteus]
MNTGKIPCRVDQVSKTASRIAEPGGAELTGRLRGAVKKPPERRLSVFQRWPDRLSVLAKRSGFSDNS